MKNMLRHIFHNLISKATSEKLEMLQFMSTLLRQKQQLTGETKEQSHQ